MAIRKDGMENWMVEDGVFIICPLEHLVERLGISEDEILEKLGHVHGIITVDPYTKIKVEKNYIVDKDGHIFTKVELTPEKAIMGDELIEPVRNLEEDELLFDEYYEKQRGKVTKDNYREHIEKSHGIIQEHKNIIMERSNKIINKT